MNPLLIRADAGGSLGAGHVMRMVALAQAWIGQGGNVTLASIECPGKFVERVQEEGITHSKLGAPDIGTEDDSTETIALAKKLGCQWVVLDGYCFRKDYQKAVSGSGLKLLVMDDFLYSPQWEADLIVNQNPNCNPNLYLNSKHPAKVLCGADYVLLRREFWRIPDVETRNSGTIRVAITMGGIDADNLTRAMIEALEEMIRDPLEIRVIIGAGNPHKTSLKPLFEGSRHSITCFSDVRDMSHMYAWADTVISAAGGTVWEWLRYGHCGGFVIAAENQEGLGQWLTREKLGMQLGYCRNGRVSIDKLALKRWLLPGEKTRRLFQEPRVDGQGAKRIVDCMLES